MVQTCKKLLTKLRRAHIRDSWSTGTTPSCGPRDRKATAVEIFEVAPPGEGPSLALHGGAGGRPEELTPEARAAYEQGLLAAYRAGWRVLAAGGGHDRGGLRGMSQDD